MSIRVVASVLSFSEARLADRLALIAIADNAHDDGIAWPGEEEIARKAKLGVSSVRKSVTALVAQGELELRKVQRGRRRINVYRVLCGKPHDVDYDRLPFEVKIPFTTTARIERSPDQPPPPESASDDRQNRLARVHEPSVEPSVGRKTSSSSPAPEERDLVWDALTATLFVPHTKHEKTRIGQAAREIRAGVKSEFGDLNGALDQRCAEEIVRRMAVYPADWHERTPEALVKHWTRLGEGSAGSERARHDDLKRRMKEHDTKGAS